MLNFTFHNPTRIQFGSGQIVALNAEIPDDARVLMIYGGGSIKSNGVYEQVKSALGERPVFEFSGIEPNPRYETLINAVDVIRQNNVDYLLAVGGGSVIDGVKFIAAAACFEGDDPWDIFTKRAPVKRALPIGVVLTLPATGSESNTGAVVTRGEDKLPFASPLVRPAFAILDPQVTLTLSPRQVGNGVVDAFVHTIEQYLTYPVNGKVQDRFAEGLLQTLIEDGPKALSEPDNIEVRANVMWSATLALNGLIGAGVPQDWSTHMIGHELTALYGIDHARTLSLILPAMMKVRRDTKRDKLCQYAERVWNIREGSDEEKISAAIHATEAFFRKMGVPVRLSEVDLGSEAIPTILNQLEKHRMTRLGEHRDIGLDISQRVLETAL
ncbi:iron-containing alcohol dehydrogenase [Oleiphilus messinensis]|uniref:Iron-containing alcohol dehydrogenase n=1 Tax=Oleiphilus messinensis TaxID=141451 RepID=A0A1Y0IIM0_9GAMM|nr:iron-containing alcohol dehydrogenase [Oleiphilus messinensis]ARU59283.1 iron-containing alcohol dehydrogenase [Oleiphilus messinensis]